MDSFKQEAYNTTNLLFVVRNKDALLIKFSLMENVSVQEVFLKLTTYADKFVVKMLILMIKINASARLDINLVLMEFVNKLEYVERTKHFNQMVNALVELDFNVVHKEYASKYHAVVAMKYFNRTGLAVVKMDMFVVLEMFAFQGAQEIIKFGMVLLAFVHKDMA